MKHVRKGLNKNNAKKKISELPKSTSNIKKKIISTNIKLIETPMNVRNTQPLINIITRTSGRPNSFKRCNESIKNQTYKNIRHIVSIDNLEDKKYVESTGSEWFFIDKEKIVAQPDIPDPKTGKKFIYNLYFNELFSKVTDGWIIILDDDDYLAHENVIQKIVSLISSDNDMVLWQMKYPHGNVLPTAQEIGLQPRLGRIGSPCIMVHSKIAKSIVWDGWKCGDYRYISKVWSKTTNKRWIAQPLILLGGAGFGLKKDINTESGDSNNIVKKTPNENIVDRFKDKFTEALPLEVNKEITPDNKGSSDNKLDYIVCISSYSRPNALKQLVNQLMSYKDTVNFKIIIVDDHSPQVKEYHSITSVSNDIIHIRNEVNYGKKGYWKTINKAFDATKQFKFKWLIQLDDDFKLCKNFFENITSEISKHRGDFIVKLHTDDTSRKVRWKLNHWVDGGALYPRTFIEKIGYNIDKIGLGRWKANPMLSSGVWMQVSQKIKRHNYRVIIPNVSYVYHLGYSDSRMNAMLRKDISIKTKNFNDK